MKTYKYYMCVVFLFFRVFLRRGVLCRLYSLSLWSDVTKNSFDWTESFAESIQLRCVGVIVRMMLRLLNKMMALLLMMRLQCGRRHLIHGHESRCSTSARHQRVPCTSSVTGRRCDSPCRGRTSILVVCVLRLRSEYRGCSAGGTTITVHVRGGVSRGR